ncbi:hypothetical protein B4166_0004 [Caldibacillus thermoamylovorans]|uniref:Uncharacterized protein n=1 Tax=Caldibacillus thermoamylovorans TaxID=35841 RepID=A0ABD4A9B5_9BACI|nr:hypothetical protein B4166_0004 [Caldibacillus thermoamylovorans]KIO73658.1 hypothetical protein B4167_0079 [Caldibacillus thermoamylovorans]
MDSQAFAADLHQTISSLKTNELVTISCHRINCMKFIILSEHQ